MDILQEKLNKIDDELVLHPIVNKYLTTLLGYCTQDEGFYISSGYTCCCKCDEIITNCSGIIDFFSPKGFFMLRDFILDRNDAEELFEKYFNTTEINNSSDLIEYDTPERLAKFVFKQMGGEV